MPQLSDRYLPCLTCEGHGIEYTGYKIICRECDGAGWKWYPVSGQSTPDGAPNPITSGSPPKGLPVM